jgi:AAA+ superfamily predicted ATPase
MSGDDESLKLMEILLTAEIFNQNPDLGINDLTPVCRELFGVSASPDVRRPLTVSEGMVRRTLGIPDACQKIKDNPVARCEEFGQRIHITTLEPAARWFLKRGGFALIERNPTLASFFEGFDSVKVSYIAVREANPPFEDSRAYLDGRIAKIIGDDERLKTALDLIILSAPEEIDQTVGDIVCTPVQLDVIAKIKVASRNRETLQRHRIHEIGKLLFVGPPGTGKTSLAVAMSREMHLPLLEVRLSMITSQYLGETSKNIDRIFDFAKRIAPCILFIDEFDYVGKSRMTDDHGAMKRAVNALLKNIDQINLIKNHVLLIGATNHPQLLDEAAWRRFDEVVEFGIPNEEMRYEILERITGHLSCHCDNRVLAARTEGFSGADLRMMVKEAMLSAMMKDSEEIGPDDIEKGIMMVQNRNMIRRLNWLG